MGGAVSRPGPNALTGAADDSADWRPPPTLAAWARLNFRQRLTFAAHLYKAVFRSYHQEMTPLLRPLVPADGVVIDVGAHAGQYAKLFARLAPDGWIHAVEPGGYARLVLAGAVRMC